MKEMKFKKLLTSRARFLLVDCPNVHGLWHTPERHRIVPTEVATVPFLSVASAVKSSGVIAKSFAVVARP